MGKIIYGSSYKENSLASVLLFDASRSGVAVGNVDARKRCKKIAAVGRLDE